MAHRVQLAQLRVVVKVKEVYDLQLQLLDLRLVMICWVAIHEILVRESNAVEVAPSEPERVIEYV